MAYNENNSIVLAIKLMIRYDKPLTTSEISYLTNTNNEIRKEVFLLIQNLYIIEANNLLINQYDHETEKSNKISALKTMATIGDNETKDFFSV
jgi:hypothetical protein